jgi:hypothetical protein
MGGVERGVYDDYPRQECFGSRLRPPTPSALGPKTLVNAGGPVNQKRLHDFENDAGGA